MTEIRDRPIFLRPADGILNFCQEVFTFPVLLGVDNRFLYNPNNPASALWIGKASERSGSDRTGAMASISVARRSAVQTDSSVSNNADEGLDGVMTRTVSWRIGLSLLVQAAGESDAEELASTVTTLLTAFRSEMAAAYGLTQLDLGDVQQAHLATSNHWEVEMSLVAQVQLRLKIHEVSVTENATKITISAPAALAKRVVAL